MSRIFESMRCCSDCNAVSRYGAWLHCCAGVFLGYSPPRQSVLRGTPEKKDTLSEELLLVYSAFLASMAGMLICAIIGVHQARKRRMSWCSCRCRQSSPVQRRSGCLHRAQTKTCSSRCRPSSPIQQRNGCIQRAQKPSSPKSSSECHMFSRVQCRGVLRNSLLAIDTLLSCSGFIIVALLPEGIIAFRIFSICCAASALSWTMACHFDWSKVSLLSLIIALSSPTSLYYMERLSRQYVALALFVVTIFKVGLIGGFVELAHAVTTQARAVRSCAYRRKRGILWLYCSVKRKI